MLPDGMESRVCDSAVSYSGLVVYLLSTGHVDLATSATHVYGVCLKSTEEWVNGAWTAQSGKPVTLQFEGVAVVRCDATHTAIAIGDPVKMDTAGYVNKGSFSTPPTLAELQNHVGIALSALALNTAGTVRVRLCMLRGVHA